MPEPGAEAGARSTGADDLGAGVGLPEGRPEVVIVGAGDRFLSGITHYTAALATGFAANGASVTTVRSRQLCPARLYPGAAHIGVHEGTVAVPGSDFPVDWWGRGLLRALSHVRSLRRPHVVIQWWTTATALTVVATAALARLRGGTVLVEFHETQDETEARHRFLHATSTITQMLLGCFASAAAVHGPRDVGQVRARYRWTRRRPVRVVSHAPYHHLRIVPSAPPAASEPINVLFFGVIRAYKGLDVAADALRCLRDRGHRATLAVVGEPWGTEGTEAVAYAQSVVGDLVTDLRFVSDLEAADWFSWAHVLAAPYTRSSASGPVQIALGAGLPVVTTDIGPGFDADQPVHVVAPGDPEAFATALHLAATSPRPAPAPTFSFADAAAALS